MSFFNSIFGEDSTVGKVGSTAFSFLFGSKDSPDSGLVDKAGSFLKDNPWASDAISYGARGAMGYLAAEEQRKAQEKAKQKEREHEKELLEMKNKQENQRYWVQPGEVDMEKYGKGWANLGILEQLDKQTKATRERIGGY